MSCPPRSQVVFEILQLKDYVAFNPITLAKLLGANTIDELVDKANEYMDTHPKLNSYYKKPTGYMIGECASINNSLVTTISINKELEKYSFENCEDLDLLLVIFGCTVNDLFIPNREVAINTSKFNNILLFPKEEVDS